MVISQIIREKRKQLGLTQENVAEYLGVSTPAVSKWENGTTYPDIMLLPALARLLKTDLNTLMSFNEEMSEIEINNVVLKVQSLIQEDGFEKGFQFALDQVRAFPTCENLIYSLGVFLQPSLGLQSVENQNKYREELAKLYFRVRNSENIEIKKIAAEGKSIAYVDEKVLFVPNTVPGDIVDVQVTRKRKSFLEGFIVNVRKYSDIRTEPFCSHFGVCGGCKWQTSLISCRRNSNSRKSLTTCNESVRLNYKTCPRLSALPKQPITEINWNTRSVTNAF